MAKFIFTATVHVQVEAESVQEAFRKFVQWRKFICSAMQGRLQEAGIFRYRVPPVREFIEVDDAWLENGRLSAKFRQEWEYRATEEPLLPGSRAMLTHKVAVGPISDKQ